MWSMDSDKKSCRKETQSDRLGIKTIVIGLINLPPLWFGQGTNLHTTNTTSLWLGLLKSDSNGLTTHFRWSKLGEVEQE